MSSLAIFTKAQLASELSKARYKISGEIGLPSARVGKGSGKQLEWPEEFDPAVLLEPLINKPLANIQSFSAHAMEENFVFATREPEHFALLTLSGDTVCLAHDLDGAQLAATFAEILHPIEAAIQQDIRIELSSEAALAFWAILDHVRLLYAASLLEKKDMASYAFVVDDLTDRLKEGKSGEDFRWFCAMIPALTGHTKVSKKEISAGCTQLVEAEYISAITENKKTIYQPLLMMLNVALEFLNPLRVIALNGSSKSKKASDINVLMLGRSMWSFSLKPDNVVVECIDGLSAFQSINEALEFDDDTLPSFPEPSASTTKAKGTPVAAMDAKNDAALNCVNCGTDNDTGSKFCNSCGASLETPNEKAAESTAGNCTQCGGALETSKKFCTSCGAKAA